MGHSLSKEQQMLPFAYGKCDDSALLDVGNTTTTTIDELNSAQDSLTSISALSHFRAPASRPSPAIQNALRLRLPSSSSAEDDRDSTLPLGASAAALASADHNHEDPVMLFSPHLSKNLIDSDSIFSADDLDDPFADLVAVVGQPDPLENGKRRNSDEKLLDAAYLDTLDEETLARDYNLRTFTFGQLSLMTIGLCSQSLRAISPNIGLLFSTTIVQLCCNDLTSIPPEIGYMRSLTSLSVAKNKITSLPDTIGFLTKLVELNASDNLLSSIPTSIQTCTKLTTLYLENNNLASLPPELGKLKDLSSLNISQNPLTVLPAEIGRLKLLNLRAEDCPNLISNDLPANQTHPFPTLKELAARVIVRHQLPILEITPDDIKDYISSAQVCSFCKGPFFQSVVTRHRWLERVEREVVLRYPLEYRLCVPHWNSEPERIAAMFCPVPSTAPSLHTPPPTRYISSSASATPAASPPASRSLSTSSIFGASSSNNNNNNAGTKRGRLTSFRSFSFSRSSLNLSTTTTNGSANNNSTPSLPFNNATAATTTTTTGHNNSPTPSPQPFQLQQTPPLRSGSRASSQTPPPMNLLAGPAAAAIPMVTLPLSSLTKSPSLPSLPASVTLTERRFPRSSFMKRQGQMRVARSMSFAG